MSSNSEPARAAQSLGDILRGDSDAPAPRPEQAHLGQEVVSVWRDLVAVNAEVARSVGKRSKGRRSVQAFDVSAFADGLLLWTKLHQLGGPAPLRGELADLAHDLALAAENVRDYVFRRDALRGLKSNEVRNAVKGKPATSFDDVMKRVDRTLTRAATFPLGARTIAKARAVQQEIQNDLHAALEHPAGLGLGDPLHVADQLAARQTAHERVWELAVELQCAAWRIDLATPARKRGKPQASADKELCKLACDLGMGVSDLSRQAVVLRGPAAEKLLTRYGAPSDAELDAVLSKAEGKARETQIKQLLKRKHDAFETAVETLRKRLQRHWPRTPLR